MPIKQRVHEIVQAARPGDKTSKAFDFTIIALIVANIIAVMLESIDAVVSRWSRVLWTFEVASVIVFSIEYLLRMWSCTAAPSIRQSLRDRVRFMLQPILVIDLLAILPFYLPFVGIDLRFVRALRLLRLFRILKLGRYSASLQLMGRVLRSRRAELSMTLFVTFLLLIVASSLMYHIEHEAQPTVFSSIPAAMWWGVATLTTVGYGDAYPVTALGKLLAAAMAVLGVGLFALPAGILGGAFLEEIQKGRSTHTCPHCGRALG